MSSKMAPRLRDLLVEFFNGADERFDSAKESEQ